MAASCKVATSPSNISCAICVDACRHSTPELPPSNLSPAYQDLLRTVKLNSSIDKLHLFDRKLYSHGSHPYLVLSNTSLSSISLVDAQQALVSVLPEVQACISLMSCLW
jgi:hypothetical protein